MVKGRIKFRSKPSSILAHQTASQHSPLTGSVWWNQKHMDNVPSQMHMLWELLGDVSLLSSLWTTSSVRKNLENHFSWVKMWKEWLSTSWTENRVHLAVHSVRCVINTVAGHRTAWGYWWSSVSVSRLPFICTCARRLHTWEVWLSRLRRLSYILLCSRIF